MRAEREPDELIGAWTLTGRDWDLIANKAGVTRLRLRGNAQVLRDREPVPGLPLALRAVGRAGYLHVSEQP